MYTLLYLDMVASLYGSGTTSAIDSGAGSIGSLYAINRNSSVRYVQFFDAINSTSGTPAYTFAIPPGTSTSPGILVLGNDYFCPFQYSMFRMAVGCTLAISTTETTYSAATASDHSVVLTYLEG